MTSLIDLVGWRLTWVILGLLILVLVVPVAYVLLRDDPEAMGLRPDGDAPLSETVPATPVRPGPLEVASWREAFRSLPMWQLCGGYAVCGLSIALLSTHFVPFAIERGFSPATAAAAYGLMSGLNVVGVLAVGAFSDRWGRTLPLGVVYALRGCAYLALVWAPGAWSLWSFAVIMGFSYWATAPLTSRIVKKPKRIIFAAFTVLPLPAPHLAIRHPIAHTHSHEKTADASGGMIYGLEATTGIYHWHCR
jgi:predicted MFS family arabinose efflux permease